MMQSTDNIEVNELIPNEIDTLKARADLMGINYHPNIGASKLKAKITNKTSGADDAIEVLKQPTELPQDVSYMTHIEYVAEQKLSERKNANRLVRCNIMCMNPDKTEWEGEIISVGSSKLGTFKKYVPFNVDSGYHIPYIMYQAIKERKYTTYSTVNGLNGQKVRKGRLVNEFNIEVLPPLTEDEINELKQQQALSGSVE
jgi:hypothetical protein